MLIPNIYIYIYLLRIHVKSVPKVFKTFNLLRVWSLGFQCLIISWLLS